MLGWKSRRDNGSHFQPKQSKKVLGVKSSIKPRGVIQHKFLKKDDINEKPPFDMIVKILKKTQRANGESPRGTVA